MRFVHPSYAAALETQATWWRPLDLSSGRVLGLSAGGCRFDSRRGRPPHYLSGLSASFNGSSDLKLLIQCCFGLTDQVRTKDEAVLALY